MADEKLLVSHGGVVEATPATVARDKELKIIKGGGDGVVEVTPSKLGPAVEKADKPLTETEKIVAKKRENAKTKEEAKHAEFIKKKEEAFKKGFNNFLQKWMNGMSEVQKAHLIYGLQVALQDQAVLINSLLVEKAKRLDREENESRIIQRLN